GRIVGGGGPGTPYVHGGTLLEERAGDPVADAARAADHQHRPAGEVEWVAHASDPLDDDRRGHAARGAHRHQPATQVAALELVEQRADQDGTRRPDRVAERDRAAIDVDLVPID